MRRMLLCAILLLASCGGSPMAPSAGTPGTPVSQLASGPYRLTVTMATGGNSGISACMSFTGASATPGFVAVSVPTSVVVERSGDTVRVTPEDPAASFRMQLQLAGTAMSGSASGSFQDFGATISVTNALGNGPASATGVAGPNVGPYVAAGSLDGSVSAAGLTCTNNGHAWTLAPR